MRWYRINALRGTSGFGCIVEVWAVGVVAAFDKVRASGAWPLSVAADGWVAAEMTEPN